MPPARNSLEEGAITTFSSPYERCIRPEFPELILRKLRRFMTLAYDPVGQVPALRREVAVHHPQIHAPTRIGMPIRKNAKIQPTA